MLVFWIVIAALAGYLLGGINGAIIISRLLAHEDVRKKGSGNAGLTNFQRNYGNKGSLLVILVDVAKTVVACLLGGALLGQFGMADTGRMLGGAACMVGHMFPLMFGFHGGKGVLCGAALAACMDWRVPDCSSADPVHISGLSSGSGGLSICLCLVFLGQLGGDCHRVGSGSACHLDASRQHRTAGTWQRAEIPLKKRERR